jgi:hypothetical protein
MFCAVRCKGQVLGQRYDLALVDLTIDGMIDCLDVTVVHPDSSASSEVNGGGYSSAAQKPVSSHLTDFFTKKIKRYGDSYQVSAQHVIPLVFDTCGTWHPKTVDYLGTVIAAVAGGDEELWSSLWRTPRYI